MKLSAQLVLLSVADGLDPAHNAQRPRLQPKQASSFTSISDFLPHRVKYDKDLYARMDEMFFSTGRFAAPLDSLVQFDSDNAFFQCGENSMSLIVRTDAMENLWTMDQSDFSLLDINCNAASNYLLWQAFESSDPSGDLVELLVVDIPLDSCGTTARFDEDTKQIIFENKVINGAFSVMQNGQDTHGGITNQAIIDYAVECKYNAVYTDASISNSAEHATLKDAIKNQDADSFSMFLSYQQMVNGGMVEFPDATYTVGDPAMFTVGMVHPNKMINVYVESCTMQSGTTESEYPIVEQHCPDVFTNTKLEDQYTNGTSLLSFTMFEFVDAMGDGVEQDNNMVCNLVLCLATDTPESCGIVKTCT